MNPAEAIQAHIGGTQRAVAELVGEHEVSWGEYIRGRKSPSARKIETWCERAEVDLVCEREGWHVLVLFAG